MANGIGNHKGARELLVLGDGRVAVGCYKVKRLDELEDKVVLVLDFGLLFVEAVDSGGIEESDVAVNKVDGDCPKVDVLVGEADP